MRKQNLFLYKEALVLSSILILVNVVFTFFILSKTNQPTSIYIYLLHDVTYGFLLCSCLLYPMFTNRFSCCL